jgi:hypothetical protein
MRRLFAVILLLLPVISFASEKPVWVESEGMAIMGEIETANLYRIKLKSAFVELCLSESYEVGISAKLCFQRQF